VHAECHPEVIENKRKGRREESVNFAKFGESANTVNRLHSFFIHPATVRAIRSKRMEWMRNKPQQKRVKLIVANDGKGGLGGCDGD
jgi:hypothetical protein